MKKKIVSFFVVGILVLSGLGAVAIIEDNITVEKDEMITLEFSPLVIEEFDSKYIEVSLEDTSSNLMNPGLPVLPKVVENVELPFGVQNVKVEVIPKNVQEYEIEGKIRPAPAFLPLKAVSNNVVVKTEKDEEIYSSEELFPSSWHSYHVGCGRNSANEIVTHVVIHAYPARYVPAEDKLFVAESFDIIISYEDPKSNPFPLNSEYDMVIIAPKKFSNDLQKFINHKNNLKTPINTTLKTTQSIYTEYNDPMYRDKPEKIKYFIKDAIENWGVKYVLLVGGLKSLIWGKPRDDPNQGSKDWLVPVRYNNIYDNPKFPLDNYTIHDPGVICDLYYADIYKEGGVFEDWDPNGDGLICGWGKEGYINDTGYDSPYEIDWYPDVSVGRLACRNIWEVRIMVDKIINHENNAYGKDWFNKMIVISGDGFLDQQDLNIQWDTKNLSDGEYKIYAQSTNPEMVSGPVDVINVTLDRSQVTNLTFNHDDHLKFDTYPYIPIAEITSPSNGDILGNTDYYEEIPERDAYCNQFLKWADLEYIDGIMHIRGKSYDPKPYGVVTDIHVWINNSAEEKVFEHTVNDIEIYYEGEWATGEEVLKGEGGALYHMPGFQKEILWSSNGKWTGQSDIMNAFNKGSGFTFFSGHGSPAVWSNHGAGIPGNRRHSHIGGIGVYDRYGPPYFPMETLSNRYKTPVTLVGGCHNSQFNVSFIATYILRLPFMWTYGSITPECWSWWLTRVSKRGSIATIGNTGLGYGVIGEDCTSVGLDGGICIEFFKQYNGGYDILGDTYLQTQANYVNNFDMNLQEHGKTLSQWVLLGDPSLKLGGYETSNQQVTIQINGNRVNSDGTPGGFIEFQANANGETPNSYEWSFDTSGDGEYDTYRTGVYVDDVTWDSSGVYWVEIKAIYDDHEETTLTIVDIENNEFPDTPTKPSGKTNVRAWIPYTYKTAATDPNNYDLYYIFDWGDGTYSWVGPKESGKVVSDTHIWKEKGDYEVTVMVVDTEAYWSDWSDPLSVSVTKTKEINNRSLLQILQKFFENYPNTFPILRQLLGL
jgi:hypothetical protein